jgi:DNA-binding transcriptional regulator YbjK
VRVAGREGLAAVTHRSVAAEAGVTHGLASYHFASRDEMVHEALVWATGKAMAETRIGEPGASLAQFAEELSQRIADDPGNARFQFEIALEGRNRPALLAEVRTLYDQYVDAIEEVLSAHGLEDDPVLARLVFAAVDGLVLQQLIYDAPRRTDACLDRLREILGSLAVERATDTQTDARQEPAHSTLHPRVS